MGDTYKGLLGRCPIRMRVSFVLAIAEAVLGFISGQPQIMTSVRVALDLAWDWEEGKAGLDAGDKLYGLLENEHDQGLLIDEWNAPADQKPAWMVVTSAIAYTSWHAYKAAAIKSMPESINEVTEDVIDQVVNYANQVDGFNMDMLKAIETFCLARCDTKENGPLGEPILRNEVIHALEGTR